MIPRCQCCDTALPDAERLWCQECQEAIHCDLLALRDAADLSVVVCVLRDAGAGKLASCIVGVVPFDYVRMMQ